MSNQGMEALQQSNTPHWLPSNGACTHPAAGGGALRLFRLLALGRLALLLLGRRWDNAPPHEQAIHTPKQPAAPKNAKLGPSLALTLRPVVPSASSSPSSPSDASPSSCSGASSLAAALEPRRPRLVVGAAAASAAAACLRRAWDCRVSWIRVDLSMGKSCAQAAQPLLAQQTWRA